MNLLLETLSNNPVIAAINNLENLDMALRSQSQIIFLNTGNIFNLKDISNRVKSKEKQLFIYLDSIDGFSKDTWGLEYIAKNIQLDGIITKKQNLVKLSKDMGIFTIEKIIISVNLFLFCLCFLVFLFIMIGINGETNNIKIIFKYNLIFFTSLSFIFNLINLIYNYPLI